ncbi:aldehyde dehydrogenase [Patellaria atrata CBS 101060]|uniref:Aldehyde dehydrogenase n=1 Tax=Patellaria atrata CBS 101060 TaxID=1346257 RepID=A0A9P4VPL4_9PEZI|nr:aldehyde dehydrogenase [Patellaria atrata CBS 101060]
METNSTNVNGTHYTVPLLINGEEVTTETTFPITSPSTLQFLHHSSSASVAEAKSAISAATAALASWRATKPSYRRDILLRAADILAERSDEIARYMKEETGALPAFAEGFNVPTTVEMIKDVAGRLAGALGGSIPVCAQEDVSAMVVKEPMGVVLGIAPWNAPLVLGFRAFVPALAAGCTAVLKGSELSPRTFHCIGSIMAAAGLPKGCLNVIYTRQADAADVTKSLIENPAVKKVNFTGSTAIGRIIAATAGKALKPVLMELGGKASAIICEDADLQKAATQVALGSFLHSGQICMATERILVRKEIVGDFKEALEKAVEGIFGGTKEAPVLIQSAAVEKNQKLIKDAVGKGAKVVYGDVLREEDSKYRMRPIVVEGVSNEMDLYHTESFGPTVSLIEVESDEEAIALANDTTYGLTGAVFTRDLRRGLKIAGQIESGAVHINSMTIHDEASLPHGGVKESGWGRFNAEEGINEFLRLKTITFQA